MNLQVVVILLLFNCDIAILKYENVLEEQDHIEVRDIKSQENVKIFSNVLYDEDDNNFHKCFCYSFSMIIRLLFGLYLLSNNRIVMRFL